MYSFLARLQAVLAGLLVFTPVEQVLPQEKPADAQEAEPTMTVTDSPLSEYPYPLPDRPPAGSIYHVPPAFHSVLRGPCRCFPAAG